ncbi:histone H2A-Bbd type 1 [Manis pentadactyla]|uniref:histone H2A-Bbd type 1 n=1 Tax=Manis pentadactyla TaxID=143292 RepID=UPI00255C389C|nr:histone H2A-Bbd type 1 [Manis pentadactyla]
MTGWGTGIQQAAVSTGSHRSPGQRDSQQARWRTAQQTCRQREATPAPSCVRSPAPCAPCAELQFPVNHVDRLLRERHDVMHLSPSMPVFLAGVLEYLTSNILELAGKEACSNQRMCITPQQLERAVDGNQHLRRLFDKNAFSEVDSVPQPMEM